ncbi:MAG: stage II sporulation protein P [Clostridium sp.]|jgi:stage II sporulation protein P|nr:stage II sporulation protein P [Clostridium sp.]
MKTAVTESLSEAFLEKLLRLFSPIFSFVEQENISIADTFLAENMRQILPFYGFVKENLPSAAKAEDSMTIEMILLAEASEEMELWYEDESGQDPAQADESGQDPAQAPDPAQEDAAGAFVPRQKVHTVDLSEFQDYETLVKNFYTIDSTTMIGSDELDAQRLAAKDMTLSGDSEGPQILIYHTHSQEGFADSVAGDPTTSIVAVGENLARILTQDYGYKVLHHKGEYDVRLRSDAYSKALPAVTQILADYPDIQVVIDLHRDSPPDGRRLVVDIDGKPTAQFMFFNGLSRTRQTGNISYLYNGNLAENLAFSFQLQVKAREYYPGLSRKIYLKGYRYNMHLKPRTTLIELGAQNNTLQEAMNACYPLAHILDLVLSGEG